jgi:hypothetical protein
MKFLSTQILSKTNAFLIDGVGALASGISLYFIIGSFVSVFGMPTSVIQNLAILPFLYCVYSLSCHYFKPQSGIYLKIIAILNLIYGMISISLMIRYANEIKPLGYVYFIVEKLIVIPLAIWEWKVSER